MSEYKGTFKCVVMTPDTLLYEKDVQSVFLTGDNGEYELLSYHFPILGILKEGNIILDWKESVPIKFGVVKFFANECVILVEEKERLKIKKEKKESDIAIDDTMDSK